MAETQTVPGALEVVRGFMNTLDVEGGTDELTTPEALVEWLVSKDLVARRIDAGEADLQLARATRGALRALAAANNGEPLAPDSLERLNQVSAAARLSLRFQPDGRVLLEPVDPGVPGALGRLLSIVADAMADGTWSRVKACRNEECEWVFYDHARNRSAKWCDMAVCGNRMKARAFRARKTRERQ